MGKKVTASVARIAAGLQEKIVLGNLDSKRDWGHARDYVKAMWMMLQKDTPEDFVIATGIQYSVRELCSFCFELIGKKVAWRGEGVSEEGVDEQTGSVLVQVSPKYFRPTEVETLPAKQTKRSVTSGGLQRSPSTTSYTRCSSTTSVRSVVSCLRRRRRCCSGTRPRQPTCPLQRRRREPREPDAEGCFVT